jgi:hypothetical protein
MNFTQYLGDFNRAIACIFVFASILITLLSATATATATNESYQLTKVGQLDPELLSQSKWQQLIANPSNKQQHFIIRESGQVYLIDDGEVNPKVILDMRVSKQSDLSFFKLTAIELHPNFSLRDQVGYGTFYTAHIENYDKNTKTKRIQAQDDDLSLSFDTVITEWQLNAVNHQKVDVKTKREVLRIGVPDNVMVIKQMSFNPNIKSWNDDFGLLYITLNGSRKLSLPLYSGVILRIDPAKYGMRSFRVPTNNPYIKNSQIHNAIYLMGGQNIEQFIWPDKSDDHILVLHQYDNKYLLSLTDGKADWRDSVTKQVLYQSEGAIQNVMIYRGRQLASLRSKLLLLRQKEQHWFIDSLVFNLSDNKTMREDKKPQVEWLITSQELPASSRITLSRNHDDEILLLEKTTSVLFRLTQQLLVNENVVVENDRNNTNEVNSSNMSVFILLIVLTLLAIIYVIFKRNSHSVKAIVRQQFASFTLSESCQQILLYQRHQKNAETIINIADLISCEIKLNEQSICLVNDQSGYGFTHVKEQDLHAIFANEKIDKMVDGKIRQITLLFTTNQKSIYTVCLYMRKGSNRITKKSYTKVVNELIDWCWFIGEKLNVEDTEKREIKSKAALKEESIIQPTKGIKTPLYNQTETIRSLTSEMDNASPSITNDELSITPVGVNENNHPIETASDKNSEVKRQTNQDNTINTELVDALEKLVNLKQQGFLTMEEFSKAKETLLKSVLEK